MAAKHQILCALHKAAAARRGKTARDKRDPRHRCAAIQLDGNGVVKGWSEDAALVTGLSAAAMVGRKLEAVCIDTHLAQMLGAVCEDPVEIILALDCGARGIVRLRTDVSARWDAAGTLTAYDVDIRTSAAQEETAVGFANGNEAAYEALRRLDMQDAPAFLVDGRNLRIVDSNPAAALALGRSPGEMTGRCLPEILDPARAQRRKAGERNARLSFFRLTDRNGAARSYGLSLVPVRWAGRNLALCVLHDLTGWVSMDDETAALNEELSRLARYDYLTGLFNRPMFRDTLALANSRVDRSGVLMAVLYIDLDGFKPINDRFGHDVGDALLVEVVRRLQSGLRASDVLARLGGDEFGAILENLKTRDDAVKVALNLVERLKEPFDVEGERIHISASIGAVVTACAVEDAMDLVARADRTMYEAKSLGRGRVALAPEGATPNRRLIKQQS